MLNLLSNVNTLNYQFFIVRYTNRETITLHDQNKQNVIDFFVWDNKTRLHAVIRKVLGESNQRSEICTSKLFPSNSAICGTIFFALYDVLI